ncbi:MAG: hypothetical protein MJ162_01315 [Treponema sp.]|nr:hypothetical protein [Treponema sp.]
MKKVLLSFLIITGFLFISCSDFLRGSDLRDQIEKEIEIANTPGFTLAVNPLIPESIVNITPSGNMEVKKGKKINIEATINNNYTFVEWRVYSKSKGTLFDLKDVKLKFDEAHTNFIGSSVIVSTTVEILDVQNDLEIVPFCKIKTDTLPPTFVGDLKVSYSKEQLNNGNSFKLAEYDENGKLIYKTDNRASKLYFDFLAEDLDKPSKIWIQETELFSNTGIYDEANQVNPDSISAVKYTSIIEDCFTHYQKTVYRTVAEYEIKAGNGLERGYSAPLLIEVKIIDESGNISEESRKFVVVKDASVTMDSCPIVSMIDNDSLELDLEETKSNLGNLFIPEIIDTYFDGKNYINESVTELDLSWGYTLECKEGKIHISGKPEPFERFYYVNNSSWNELGLYEKRIQVFETNVKGYNFQLPEDVIVDGKNLYLSITATDSIGNTTTVTKCLFKQPEVKQVAISKINEQYYYHIFIDHKNDDNMPEYYELKYLIYTDLEDASRIRVDDIIELNTDMLSLKSILPADYDSIGTGEKICDIYLQICNKGNDGSLLGGQLSKYTLVKGELLNEQDFASAEAFNLEDYCSYEVESTPAIDTGIMINSVICKIELPPSLLEKYNWSFVKATNDDRFEDIKDFKFSLTEGSVSIIATAYDKKTGKKIVSDKYQIAKPEESAYDTTGPRQIFTDDYTGSYNTFSILNYAGSGVRVSIDDENGIKKDSRGTSFAEFQNLPRDYFSAYWDMYKTGFKDYPYHKIYEQEFYEKKRYSDMLQKTPYHDLVIPLYLLSRDECNFCVLEMTDDSPNANVNRDFISFIRWDNISEKPVIDISKSPAEISLTKDLSNYSSDIYNYYDCYSANLEFFDETSNLWKLSKSYNGKLASSLFEHKETYELSTNKFYRFRIAIEKRNNVDALGEWYPRFDLLVTKPEYFYSNKKSCNNKLMIQGTNGIQISYDMPVLVQTYYAEKNLGSKLSDWELQAPDINAKLYKPVSNGTACVSEYYYDAALASQQVPEGYYYIVAAYFSDGTSSCTSVLQK